MYKELMHAQSYELHISKKTSLGNNVDSCSCTEKKDNTYNLFLEGNGSQGAKPQFG